MKWSWQTFLSPLKGQCQYQALLGLFQTTRSTGGFDCLLVSRETFFKKFFVLYLH